MSPPASAPEEPPLDLAVLAADDRLLDALGRGEPPPVDDPGAVLLAAWLADLTVDESPATATMATAAGIPGGATAGTTAAIALPLEPDGVASVVASGNVAPLVEPDDPAVPVLAPGGTGRRRGADGGVRRGGRLVLGAAAVVVLLAALGIGAGHAGPASPLWPVVQLVSPQRAEVRAAEHTITLARTAAKAGRYGDASRLLDEATTRVTRVRDVSEAGRLRADIERVRTTLPAAVRPDEAGPRPSGAPRSAPAAPPVTTAPGTAPSRRLPAGTPGPGGSPAGAAPPAPTQVPLIPPLRSLLPSLLPSLPPLPIIGALHDTP